MGKQPAQQDRLKDWRETLRYTDLEVAKAALDAIYSGELKLPRAFNQLPVVILKYARDKSPRCRNDSEPVWNHESEQYSFKCLECDDIGMLTVVRVETQIKMRDQPDEVAAKDYHDGTVACNCEKGKSLSHQRKGSLPQYNERTMCRMTTDAVTREDKLQVLREWMDARRGQPISEHPNFNKTLEGWE